MLLKVLWSAVLSSLFATVVLVGCSAKPNFHGGVIDPPFAAPEIKMVDQNGNPFQLSTDRGRVVLVFFGYTNCPDECPATMAHIKLALDAVGDTARNIQVVFVTTDP